MNFSLLPWLTLGFLFGGLLNFPLISDRLLPAPLLKFPLYETRLRERLKSVGALAQERLLG